MKIKQFEIWIADLNPRMGTETGKIRPVLVVQTDLLNGYHPSTLVCPITTSIQLKSDILRVHLKKGMAKLKEDCDIMIDQLRSIDNRRLQKKVGAIPEELEDIVRQNLKIILDL
jgi:mRNA interferase MazF